MAGPICFSIVFLFFKHINMSSHMKNYLNAFNAAKNDMAACGITIDAPDAAIMAAIAEIESMQ